ncbi:class I SAM-dependent methyltransferase [Polynucleobacter paneuropaeus]|nr:class I SAM-dependent methyltransferase [Polynucleobacter paneuropaeus]
MQNILQDTPYTPLSGRLFASTKFISEDIVGKKILDIGCGYGWFEIFLLSKSPQEVVGMECSTKDLNTISEHINDNRLTLKVGSAILIPYQDNTFDIVTSWEVIEHIPKNSESKMLTEISRVLKPGGSAYLSTPKKSLFSNLLDPAWILMGHRHYQYQDFKKFSEAAKLDIVNFEVRGGWFSLLFALNMYFSKWVLKRGPLFNKFFQAMDHREYLDKDGFATIFIQLKKPSL